MGASLPGRAQSKGLPLPIFLRVQETTPHIPPRRFLATHLRFYFETLCGRQNDANHSNPHLLRVAQTNSPLSFAEILFIFRRLNGHTYLVL
jgi:hypothetical protein